MVEAIGGVGAVDLQIAVPIIGRIALRLASDLARRIAGVAVITTVTVIERYLQVTYSRSPKSSDFNRSVVDAGLRLLVRIALHLS